MGRPRKNETENNTATEIEAVVPQAKEENKETVAEAKTSEQTVQAVESEATSAASAPGAIDVEALLARIKELEAQVAANKQGGQSADGVVQMEYIDCVSDQNELDLGDYGYIRGSTGSIDVPRKDFGGRFMTPLVRWLLDTRRLIVLDGLTADERKRYNVDYKDGEVMDTQAFDRLLDMDLDRLTSIFERLCTDHKWFFARRFITAYDKGDNRVSRSKVERLNEISKTDAPNGMFRPVLEGMNKL